LNRKSNDLRWLLEGKEGTDINQGNGKLPIALMPMENSYRKVKKRKMEPVPNISHMSSVDSQKMGR
jgi:hypothetical protein